MSEALVKYNSLPVVAMKDLQQIGEAIAQSGMFGVKNAASGLVVAATCHQQNMTLLDFMRTFHIIDNRPSMKADAMLAKFRMAGGRYKIIENGTTRAAAEFEFEGNTYALEYTIEDAKRTGDCYEGKSTTIKFNWQRRPDDMLWARLVSRAVRRLAPEIVSGLYTPEEVEDFAETRPMKQVEISVTDAAQRAATAKPIETTADEIDYTTCPLGGPDYEGRKWEDIETEVLHGALGYECVELTEGHKNEIRRVLFDRAQ